MRAGRRGLFISVDGADGGGKSTQARRLAEHLRNHGHAVLATREPGGSPGGEAIRNLLVDGETTRWTALAEALLMYAARAEHLAHLIRPALARGETVVTDRFADATMAYQGLAGGAGADAIGALHRTVVGEDEPDLTLILDIPAATGLGRAKNRGAQESRFERKGAAYQERVRQAFLEIARENPDRCVIIDAAADEDAVFASIAKAVEAKLSERR